MVAQNVTICPPVIPGESKEAWLFDIMRAKYIAGTETYEEWQRRKSFANEKGGGSVNKRYRSTVDPVKSLEMYRADLQARLLHEGSIADPIPDPDVDTESAMSLKDAVLSTWSAFTSDKWSRYYPCPPEGSSREDWAAWYASLQDGARAAGILAEVASEAGYHPLGIAPHNQKAGKWVVPTPEGVPDEKRIFVGSNFAFKRTQPTFPLAFDNRKRHKFVTESGADKRIKAKERALNLLASTGITDIISAANAVMVPVPIQERLSSGSSGSSGFAARTSQTPNVAMMNAVRTTAMRAAQARKKKQAAARAKPASSSSSRNRSPGVGPVHRPESRVSIASCITVPDTIDEEGEEEPIPCIAPPVGLVGKKRKHQEDKAAKERRPSARRAPPRPSSLPLTFGQK